MLEKNYYSACALSIMLLSDGRPSDFYLANTSRDVSKAALAAKSGEMASRFGRRFSFFGIGMGSAGDFNTLEEMSNSVDDHGGEGKFRLPSMTSAAIGAAISSVATSMTQTQTEMTMVIGKNGKTKQKRVKECIRENRKHIPLFTEVVSSEEFDIYVGKDMVHRME